ncbi:MAG: hypothetical protein ACREBJ_06025 [Nitrosotalea sp.]
MRKNKRLDRNNQVELLKYEQKACREIIATLRSEGWGASDEDIYLDADWGWTILADKYSKDYGVLLRRIRPFQLSAKSEVSKAATLQEKLRRDLVEVYPYVMKADKNRNMKVELLEPLFSMS